MSDKLDVTPDRDDSIVQLWNSARNKEKLHIPSSSAIENSEIKKTNFSNEKIEYIKSVVSSFPIISEKFEDYENINMHSFFLIRQIYYTQTEKFFMLQSFIV